MRQMQYVQSDHMRTSTLKQKKVGDHHAKWNRINCYADRLKPCDKFNELKERERERERERELSSRNHRC